MPTGPFGPPVPGAPWTQPTRPFADSAGTGRRAPVPQPAPDPVPAGAGQRRQAVQRLPNTTGRLTDQRLRQNTQLLASWFNDLVRKGVIVQEGADDWTLDVSGVAGGTDGLTGEFSDGTFGEGLVGGATGSFSDGDFAGFDADDPEAGGVTGDFSDGDFP